MESKPDARDARIVAELATIRLKWVLRASVYLMALEFLVGAFAGWVARGGQGLLPRLGGTVILAVAGFAIGFIFYQEQIREGGNR